MDHRDVVVPGARDVRGTLDGPESEACVVACPPHPQLGGTRSDRRLTAVADALADRGIATLRFDYGEWDDGRGERADITNALSWARERYDRIGLFGYSFGAFNALLVAAEIEYLVGVSVLAPDEKAVDALADITAPLQVLYGVRDTTVDWKPVVERARELNDAGRDPPIELIECSADHHFVGQDEKVAGHVSEFLARLLE